MGRAGENLQWVVRCPRASNGGKLLLQPGLKERGGGGLRGLRWSPGLAQLPPSRQ